MKKIIVISLIIGCLYLIPKDKAKEIVIPDEAIRFRVIANSDEMRDQLLTNDVKTSLNKKLSILLKKSTNINQSRQILNNNLNQVQENVEQTLNDHNSLQKVNVNYGMNYFPQKEYKGITYPQGEYESLVVTLGDGQGQNWWCVLFPPLCLLEAEDNNTDDIEYQFFVKKIIDKFSK